jgi:phytoene synthase
MTDSIRLCYETIQAHSKSFALASRLLAPRVRERAVVIYAWCRRADDAVDLAGRGEEQAALHQLQQELGAIYAGRNMADPVLSEFQRVVMERGIPRAYPEALLDGMRMDVEQTQYRNMADLLNYCYRVAGTVGLMMCHVMGLVDQRAARNAVHLGIAMQITNICRDVLEDWERGRLYIPEEILASFGYRGLDRQLGREFPEEARTPVSRAIAHLLDEADRFYLSGDDGLSALSWRCALSIRTARRVYAAIGGKIREQDCDPLAGRAVVTTRRKLALTSRALMASIADLPRGAGVRLSSSVRLEAPRQETTFPGDVLPV